MIHALRQKKLSPVYFILFIYLGNLLLQPIRDQGKLSQQHYRQMHAHRGSQTGGETTRMLKGIICN